MRRWARTVSFATGVIASLLIIAVGAAGASAATVDAWGLNDDGQLGNGTTTGPEHCLFNKAEHACSVSPLLVSEVSEVTAVAAGQFHSLALLEGGTVEAWGRNSSGQLGNGTTTGSDVPVAVSGLSEVTAVAAGTNHSLALLSNGTVEAWGGNESGQVGDGTTTAKEVPVPVTGLTGVVAIAAGNGYSLALLEGGTVEAWGRNEAGQLGTGNTTPSTVPVAVTALTGVTAISAGFAHNLALLGNGTVKAWGFNNFGQLGNGETAGPQKCTIKTEPLEQVACSTKPVAVKSLSGASAVAAGEQHSLAALSGGGAMAWGSNEEGQLGNGTLNESDVPVAVSGLGQVSAVAAGGRTSMALLPSGGVMAWGANYYGQVGDSTNVERLKPVMACGVSGATGVATRGGHSLAVAAGAPTCPSVTGISPTSGSGQGGTSVTITGTDLAEATAVHFGNANAASFIVESPTTVVAVSPPGSGIVDVTVTTPSGKSATGAPDRFTYQAAPKVTHVTPTSGPTSGGTPVTITGSGFTEASEVNFGSTPAASFTVESATTIKATSPAHATGTVDITVTGTFGTSATGAEDRFTFLQLEAPEFGRCLKVAVGQGAYGNAGCSVTGGERKWEWFAGFGDKPLIKRHFTQAIKTGTEAKLTTSGGQLISCTGQTGHGEYATAKTLSAVGMTFTGCHRGELGKCESAEAAEGQVVTNTLKGELGVITTSPEGPAKNKIGIDLAPASGETVSEFSCAGVPVVVTGSVIVEIKANAMLSKATLKFVGAKGVQKPSKFEGGGEDVLRTTIGEAGVPEKSVLTLTTIQTNEEKVEVNSVV